MHKSNRSLDFALKALLKAMLFVPLSCSFFLLLSQLDQGFNKSVVTGDIVSVGHSTIKKIKVNVRMTL